jgi:hypothetical protein
MNSRILGLGIALAIGAVAVNGCNNDDTGGGAGSSGSTGDGGTVTSAKVCEAGAKKCATKTIAAVCLDDGSAWLPAVCAAGESCNNGECKADGTTKPAPVCAAGSGSCVDATTALRCKADLTGYDSITCPAKTACTGDGLCQGACIVGSSKCLDTGVLGVCADGQTYAPTACQNADLCVATGTKPWPTAACKAAACKPSTSGCDWSCGNKNDAAADQTKFRSRCVETPTGYKYEAEGCVASATCNPTGGSCGGEGSQAACTSQCTPGSSRCSADGTGTQTCGADGKWAAATTACNPTNATSYVCMTKPDDDTKVVCGDPLCAQGYKGTCDGGSLKACGADGRIAAAATACSSGTCVAAGAPVAGTTPGACQAECSAGEERCVGSSNAFQTCTNGRWSAATTCPNFGDGGIQGCFGATDALGKSAKFCGGQCAPGTRRCLNADGGVGNGGIQVCNATATWDAPTACSVGVCQAADGIGATCVAECIPNTIACAGSAKSVAGTGYTGKSAYGTCTAQGLLPTTTTDCTGAATCRTNLQGKAIVVGGNACLECVGSGVAGGNERGFTDTRCSTTAGDASGTDGTQSCGASNTWAGAVKSCAPGKCGTTSDVGGACFTTGGYATANFLGNKKIVFAAVPQGTAVTTNADYKALCEQLGFAQNENPNTPGTNPPSNSNASYYCGQYCCYLGNGNSTRNSLSNFQNFGLPTNVALQVFDRGCGDYCGSYVTGLNTTDQLTVTSGTTFSYNPNGNNYCNAKSTTFATSGVIVCQVK